jgi:hypothetical protein
VAAPARLETDGEISYKRLSDRKSTWAVNAHP